MLEELMLQKKTLQEIADFLGVSRGTVGKKLKRTKPQGQESGYRYGLGDWEELKSQVTTFGNGYTLRDLDYIKEHDKSYYKYLLTNDYVKEDIDYSEVIVKPSKELKMDEVYKSVKNAIEDVR